MTTQTTRSIHEYCDVYGDRLIELMDICNANNTQSVPEEEALNFLEKLRKEQR